MEGKGYLLLTTPFSVLLLMAVTWGPPLQPSPSDLVHPALSTAPRSTPLALTSLLPPGTKSPITQDNDGHEQLSRTLSGLEPHTVSHLLTL